MNDKGKCGRPRAQQAIQHDTKLNIEGFRACLDSEISKPKLTISRTFTSAIVTNINGLISTIIILIDCDTGDSQY